MSINKNLSMTQNQILAVMTSTDRPMTMAELAKEIGCTFQTISNNMHKLKALNLIVESHRIGNAMKWKLGDPASSLMHITWGGEEQTIAELMRKYADENTPVGNLSQHSKAILLMFAEMYLICADSMDADYPKVIPLAVVKQMQALTHKRRAAIRLLLETYDSLVDNDKLWDPKELPVELIIKDEEIDLPMARSIAQNIKEKLA